MILLNNFVVEPYVIIVFNLNKEERSEHIFGLDPKDVFLGRIKLRNQLLLTQGKDQK